MSFDKEASSKYLRYRDNLSTKDTIKIHKKDIRKRSRMLAKRQIEEEYDRVEDIEEYIEAIEDNESWDRHNDYDVVYYSSYGIPDDVTLVFTTDYYNVMVDAPVDVVYEDDESDID